ncbi:helix-turn-helix transcriptional regulator [Streptomyces sp. MK7]|uniref:helix-turn-helix domain-containing protein n=1 Tax=Streptomyces sp. MK7 TaxID=3067635 RepID=UPI002931C70B|nr:helix-turn-helix transcriptional regulator [Streptomyces sp. MK7]
MKIDDVGAAFGAQVKQAREARSWSQAELARRLSSAMDKEVNPLVITRIEGNKRPVSIAELVALASIFGTTPGSLLEGMSVDADHIDHIEADRSVGRWVMREAAARRSLSDLALYLKRHPHTRGTVQESLYRAIGAEASEIMRRLDDAEVEDEPRGEQEHQEAPER